MNRGNIWVGAPIRVTTTTWDRTASAFQSGATAVVVAVNDDAVQCALDSNGVIGRLFYSEFEIVECATKPETILEEAQRLIYGERATSYGKARPSFQRIADLWSATTGYDITPEQVVLCMIQLKVAREVNAHQRDNIVDIAGYAGCFQKLADDE